MIRAVVWKEVREQGLIAILLAALILFVLWRGEYSNRLGAQDDQDTEHRVLILHFEKLMTLVRDIVLLFGPDGRVVDGNRAAIAAYGYSSDDFRRLGIGDLFPPEELARLDAMWDRFDTSGDFLEALCRRKDGSTFPVEMNGQSIPVNDKVYRQCLVRDVSRRKALESEMARLSQPIGDRPR